MVINENSVGLIVHSEHLESAVQGIILLILYLFFIGYVIFIS